MEKPMILDNTDFMKEFEFEEYIKNLSDDYSLVVFRLNAQRRRAYAGTIFSVDVHNDNLYEIIKKEFGGGEFFVQTKTGNRLGKGATLFIENPEEKKPVTPSTNPEIEALRKQIETLASAISQKPSEDSEIKVLEKMKMYKEILGGGSGMDVNQVFKMFEKGMELGKSIQNPEPIEKEDNGILNGLIGAIPSLIQRFSGNRQAAVIPGNIPNPLPAQNENQENEYQSENEEEEMKKLQYIGLYGKIKTIAREKDKDSKDQLISTLANEIIDYFPELTGYMEYVKDKEALNSIIAMYQGQLKLFRINPTEEEKNAVIDTVNEIQRILNASKNGAQ